MKTEEIQARLERGYTMAIYGTRENIHEQMTNDIKSLLKAINYSSCCTELKDKEAPKIEDWLKDNFKRLDRHSFTNTNEDTIWLRSELVEIYNQLHL